MNEAPALTIAPPAFLADPALRLVLSALPEARVVGGAVRDALAGRDVSDIDLATPRRPEEVAAALAAAGLKSAPTGLAHGTLTAIAAHRGFEVTSLRRDVLTDGRWAVVDFTDDWREDAARRDFSINAMSMTASGAVFDYFGGIDDLRAGRVRFVGDAATRIAEDYLRILRFFRFWARYGTGAPDAAAMAAIGAAVPGLARLSAERVWSELKRILAAPDPVAAVGLMEQLGVLASVLPEGASPARLAALVASGAPADPLLRLAALLTGDAAALATRLRLATAEGDRLCALRAGTVVPAGADDASLRRALAEMPRDILIGRVWLAGGDAALLLRLTEMPAPVFPLRGQDVRDAGVPAGPAVGAVLRELREWWLAGGCMGDVRAEMGRRMAAAAGSRSMPRRLPFPPSFPPVVVHQPWDSPLRPKAHPDYPAAKAGDAAAAARFVGAMMTEDATGRIHRMIGPNRPTLIAVHAEERLGRNAIPQVFATLLGLRLGLPVELDIVQSNRPRRTGRSNLYRLLHPSKFQGAVRPGLEYVMVDDHISMGGTLADLRSFVEGQGGVVLGAATLTGIPDGELLAPASHRLVALRERMPELDAWWKEVFGYGIDGLTHHEAGYLGRFNSLESLRNQIATAAQARDPRAGDADF